MNLMYMKSSHLLTGQHNNRVMSFISLNLLTKTIWKLKTPGGILVFRLLVQVWEEEDSLTHSLQRVTTLFVEQPIWGPLFGREFFHCIDP